LQGLLELLDFEADPSAKIEFSNALDVFRQKVEKLSLKLFLSGKYDAADAILSIHAGTGGVDAQDWAEMLLRMYLRFFERQGWSTTILDRTAGEEAGLKSATVEVRGEYAYGYLKCERGVHRLVRLSPFNAKNLRQTSFALVEVLPEIGEGAEIEIKPEELEFSSFRSGGAGGQHVNKTESAVRILHKPTGLIVKCQSEKSQAQNRASALKILRAKLLEREENTRAAELKKIQGGKVEASWGNQIRSYVLQPYKLVKDHRTDHETAQAEKVLDGELLEFIEAYLKRSG
jgi:peptide chain release factor 2